MHITWHLLYSLNIGMQLFKSASTWSNGQEVSTSTS